MLLAATDERERVIVLPGLQEGLRCCEISNLELGDTDLDDRVLRVIGKGGHERFVPLSDQTARAIRGYLAVYPATAGPLIRSYRHTTRSLTPGRVSDMVSRVFRDAGVKQAPRDGRSAHALRHTAATAVLRNCNGNIKLVQQFLGHQSSQTTDRYTSQLLAVTELRDAADGREY